VWIDRTLAAGRSASRLRVFWFPLSLFFPWIMPPAKLFRTFAGSRIVNGSQ
jgi:hypothetical protein